MGSLREILFQKLIAVLDPIPFALRHLPATHADRGNSPFRLQMHRLISAIAIAAARDAAHLLDIEPIENLIGEHA